MDIKYRNIRLRDVQEMSEDEFIKLCQQVKLSTRLSREELFKQLYWGY